MSAPAVHEKRCNMTSGSDINASDIFASAIRVQA
jgi:hypothetical protein